MLKNLQIHDLLLKSDDVVYIVSRLFEDSELSYYSIAKYVGPSFRKDMHDIVLLVPQQPAQIKRRYVRLPALEDEIADFVFRVVR